MGSAGRPAHRPPAEDMQVEVKDTLAGVGPAVGDDPEARVGDPRQASGAGGEEEKVAEEFAVLCGALGNGNHVSTRDDQQVHRSLRVEILEDHGALILEDDAGSGATRGDTAEDALTHGRSSPH